jgi:uncharacterized protein YbjT (DUF2867 family)
VSFDPAVIVHRADMLVPDSLRAVGDGYTTVYYLVHSMGRRGDSDYETRDAGAAFNFVCSRSPLASSGSPTSAAPAIVPRPRTCARADRPGRSCARRAAADMVRAGMVVGCGSESYRTPHSPVEHLPVMLAPSWLSTPTQAIAIADVVRYLVETPRIAETGSREMRIGSAEILTYAQMLDRMADTLGLRRRPRIPVPLLRPWLSLQWIGLVTSVDAGVARPLIEGLPTDTTVTDSSGMDLFDFPPRSSEWAPLEAIAEEESRLLARSSR